MAIKRSPYALVALAGALFCVAASTVPTAVTETESPTRAPGECEQYCSGSYPKHTYPEPSGHAACARGCRLQQLEAYLVYPSRLSSTDTACKNTCAKAYSDSYSRFACQFGCRGPSLSVFEPQASPSEDVWVLSTLYEMVFLKQALERLDWQADELASQHKDGVIIEQLVVFMYTGGDGGVPDTVKKEANNSYSGNSFAIGVDGDTASVTSWHTYVAYLGTLWSSSSGAEKKEEEPTKEVDLEYVEGYEWDCHLSSANWRTLLDVFIVFVIVLLVLGLVDLCSARRLRNTTDMHMVKTPVFPVFSESDADQNIKKRPLCVQDSNRYSYVPQEDKFVEGTLTVIRP